MLKCAFQLAVGLALASQTLAANIKSVPAAIADGPSNALFQYTGQNLEAPQISSVNATSFEWWYFDGVSYPDENGNQSSITIVFYTATAGGFDLLQASPIKNLSVDLIDLTIVYPNGTRFRAELNETQATFVNRGENGVDAYYDGSNAFFSVSPDLSHASIHISAPAQGVVGTFRLDSVAPPHLPGTPLEVGGSLEAVPNLGWFNSIPDAEAWGEFMVLGNEFKFEGRGYHDKNWGVQPTHTIAPAWYWGHATLGNYSIVWGDTLDVTNTEHPGIYIAKDGEIQAAQIGGMLVRPFGPNATYPPHISSPPPDGFTITSDNDLLNVTVTIGSLASGGPGSPYYRWAGTISGTVCGQDCGTGPAFFEQLTFLP